MFTKPCPASPFFSFSIFTFWSLYLISPQIPILPISTTHHSLLLASPLISTYTYPAVSRLPSFTVHSGGGGVKRRRRGEEESRLESIRQWRHQCFTVGTLLIALLYNYSTCTPSFWLLNQSCLQFFLCSSALCLFFLLFCYFHPSVCICKLPFIISPSTCVPKSLTNWVTRYLCVYWWHVRCIDTLISTQGYHILHKEIIWLTLCAPLEATSTHSPLYCRFHVLHIFTSPLCHP